MKQSVTTLEITTIQKDGQSILRTMLFTDQEKALNHFKYGRYTEEVMKLCGELRTGKHYFCSGIDFDGRSIMASIYNQEIF
jgi:hypothetical protein